MLQLLLLRPYHASDVIGIERSNTNKRIFFVLLKKGYVLNFFIQIFSAI